jgi:toxin ParE1/3/4
VSQFRLTPRAARDLDAIAEWTLRHWGAARMEQYLRALDDRFHWLAQNPGAGRPRYDVRAGYRSIPEGQHIVFYVVQADAIAIIGIPHQAMDIDGLFR